MNQEPQPDTQPSNPLPVEQPPLATEPVQNDSGLETQSSPVSEEKALPLNPQNNNEQSSTSAQPQKMESKTYSVTVLVVVALLIAVLLTILALGVYRGL